MKRSRVAMVAILALAALLALAVVPPAVAESNARLPAGTKLQVRIIEKLTSENANVGDLFHGTLAQPVVVNGKTVYPQGADVTGEVVKVERSGRLSNPGQLQLVLRSIRLSFFHSYALSVQPLLIKGTSHTKSNVGKIGGGAAAGAIIGGIADGGKGAAIGAGVGTAAGTGVAAATGKREAVVESEAVLAWLVDTEPVSGYADNQQGHTRSRDDNEYRISRNETRERDYDGGEDDDEEGYYGTPHEFSARERQIIRGCLLDSNSNLPPGLAKRDRLPPGLERQLQRNGTLPPGLQKRVQPLPGVCETRLPRLPQDWARVVLGGRIILLDPVHRIIDLFLLDSDD